MCLRVRLCVDFCIPLLRHVGVSLVSAAPLTAYVSVIAAAAADILLFQQAWARARASVRRSLRRFRARPVRLEKQAHDKRTSRCAARKRGRGALPTAATGGCRRRRVRRALIRVLLADETGRPRPISGVARCPKKRRCVPGSRPDTCAGRINAHVEGPRKAGAAGGLVGESKRAVGGA